MARFYKRSVLVTTAAGGGATVYLPDADGTAPLRAGEVDPLAPLSGEVRAVIYTKDDFDNGVAVAVTAEETGLNVWTEAAVNASKTVHPMVPASSQAGVALVYAAADPVPAGPPVLASERLKIAITSGGNAKSGTFTAIFAG